MRISKLSAKEFDIILTKLYENYKDSPDSPDVHIYMLYIYDNVLRYVSKKAEYYTIGGIEQSYAVPALKGYVYKTYNL